MSLNSEKKQVGWYKKYVSRLHGRSCCISLRPDLALPFFVMVLLVFAYSWSEQLGLVLYCIVFTIVRFGPDHLIIVHLPNTAINNIVNTAQYLYNHHLRKNGLGPKRDCYTIHSTVIVITCGNQAQEAPPSQVLLTSIHKERPAAGASTTMSELLWEINWLAPSTGFLLIF